MRATIATICLSLWCANAAMAEPTIPAVSYPALARHAATAEAFVPAGWRLESRQSGDLNGDGREDLVLVLRGNDPRNIVDMREIAGPEKFDTNPRILAAVISKASGGYDLALENHTLVARTVGPSAQDPLDPNGVQEGGVVITNGTLQVTVAYFGGNMGHLTYTFRFEKGQFKLIGYDSIDVERAKGTVRQVSINYSNRRMKRSIGSISDDTDKVTWTALPRKPMLTMHQVGDGLEFAPAPNSR